MQLLTKAQKNKMIKNHQEQDGTKDFKAVVKLFNPTGNGTWYLSELDPETRSEERRVGKECRSRWSPYH